MINRKDFAADKFPFSGDLNGISLETLKQHFKLYEGYVKKTNEIQVKVDATDKKDVSAIYSVFGELKRQETFAVNGMKLHEIYFNQLGGDGAAKGEILKMIEADFGSLETWQEEMVATGLTARGWAILAYDFKDDRLHIYGMDSQNVGAVWTCAPLIALDIYEHAYFKDYGVARTDYIKAFFANLNWEAVNKMVIEYSLDKRHAEKLKV